MRKYLLLVISTMAMLYSFAQQAGWQNKDLQKDSVFWNQFRNALYHELLQNKKSRKVIVAVMDTGIDTAHADLKNYLWTNPGEKQNGKTTTITDTPMTCTAGISLEEKTAMFNMKNLELTRLIREQQGFYDSISMGPVPEQYQRGYQSYRKMKKVTRRTNE